MSSILAAAIAELNEAVLTLEHRLDKLERDKIVTECRLNILERDCYAALQCVGEQALAIKRLEERISTVAGAAAGSSEALRGLSAIQSDTLADIERRLHALESALTPAIYSFAPTSVPIDTPEDGE